VGQSEADNKIEIPESFSVPVVDMSGGSAGSYDFAAADIAKGISKQLLHDVVVMYEANRRVGTSATKSRGMVQGSTKKMYRQKGTGNARAGSKRSPIRRGGGHTFAKVTRDYSYRLPKKAIQLATRQALLSKFVDDQVKIVDSIQLESPKTKVVAGMLGKLELAGVSTLLAIESYDPVVLKSARNIEGVWVRPVAELNAYDLLRQRVLVITKGGLDALLESYKTGKKQEEVAAA